jgi:hypothetical protein
MTCVTSRVPDLSVVASQFKGVNTVRRKHNIILLLLTCFCGLLIYLLSRENDGAPELTQLLVPANTPMSSQPEGFFSKTLRSRYVIIATEAIEAQLLKPAKKGPEQMGILSIDLFDDVSLPFQITEIDSDESAVSPPLVIFSGNIVDVDYSIATLTIKNRGLFGNITTPGKSFRIVPINPPLHRVDELESTSNGSTFMFE